MKQLLLLSTLVLASCTAPAFADPLSALQNFTLSDVKQAEVIYAANPEVQTAPSALVCLGWLDATLSAPGAPITFGLVAPKGAVSALADLDVALYNENNGIPKAVIAFNTNCGAYVENLKAAAVAHAGPTLSIFGLRLIP